jgi:hypothetical protein
VSYLDDFKKLMRLGREASVFDDPEWRRRDTERWDAHPWRLDKVRREGRGRGPKREATGATGGESCNPGREEQLNEETG